VARGRHGRRGDVALKVEEPALVRATEVVIGGPIAVRVLAERMGVSGAELIKSLIRLGIVASLNQILDTESARIAVSEMGLVVHAAQPEAVEGEATPEEKRPPVPEEDRPEDLKSRSPIVTVMGHVDHGKTSLLDAIRKTNVTAGEAGGITQHIGASTVEWSGKRIVFLDTPGHEAFTAMRARGAQVTDIAVLVVAADDGVMPQTLEAINHARAAKVPILVALNKIDKVNALPDRVKKQLSEIGLASEDWGGKTVVVPVSAKVGTGIDDLLDMILLVAEMGELKANPGRRARGIVIETRLDKGLGPVASVLVQSGTLRVGDPILAGTAFGRVRAMADDKGQRLEEAGPATPVEVTGLDELPAAGDVFQVLADEKMAREIAAQRDIKRRAQELGGGQAATSLEDLFRRAIEGEKKQLNLVLKADVQGSLEALKQSFEKLEEPEVGIEIIHTGVGGVRETDVMLAAASDAIIIAFNVTPDPGARQAAEQRRVDVRTYRIIYDAINDVKAALKGLRAPIYREVVLGHATIRQLFKIPKVGTIAGCYVTDGKITRKNRLRVVRDGVIVHDGPIASLRHVKDDVRDIAAGFECGIGLENFQDVKEGDVLEAFAMEEVSR
jgi:translation initiation factor IF-2